MVFESLTNTLINYLINQMLFLIQVFLLLELSLTFENFSPSLCSLGTLLSVLKIISSMCYMYVTLYTGANQLQYTSSSVGVYGRGMFSIPQPSGPGV